MKKKNLVATLAIIAVSAIPLMAQQYATPDTETMQQVQNATRNACIITVLEEENQNVANNINTDINSTAKYEQLFQKYQNFLDLMKDESLAELPSEIAEQTIFIRIDDLAQAILNLPEHAQPYYIKTITESRYYFKYQEKAVNLTYLFNLSKSVVTTQYALERTAISQVLKKQNTIKNTTTNTFWSEFFQSIVRVGQTEK